MRIVRLAVGDSALVVAASHLFDSEPTESWTTTFLASDGHHLLLAINDDDRPVGFVTGVETTHPDKGTEMFLYELGVDPEHRRRGVGKGLVEALAALARERGCYGMWVAVDTDNVAALATYRAASALPPEPCVTLGWDFEANA